MGFEPIILDNPYPEFSEPLIKAGIPKNAVDNAGAEALAELRALSDEKLLFRVISANGEALKHTTDPAKALATAILMELCDALPPNPRLSKSLRVTDTRRMFLSRPSACSCCAMTGTAR